MTRFVAVAHGTRDPPSWVVSDWGFAAGLFYNLI
jgi:hypothetical protein